MYNICIYIYIYMYTYPLESIISKTGSEDSMCHEAECRLPARTIQVAYSILTRTVLIAV